MMVKRNSPSNNNRQIHLAIFASGTGTNTKKIIEHFKNNPHIKIEVIVTNKAGAGVLQVAKENNIDQLLISKDQLTNNNIIQDLRKRKIDLIILAGFLLKIPPVLIQAFPKKIINIHPALLPAYGGKGMYGMHVHEAVIANKEKQSGISIHYVDEIYDHGEIIFQATCNIGPADNAKSLAQKIHELEHAHYAAVIETVLKTIKNQNLPPASGIKKQKPS
jgi:phosphoribosylglycinamide formyltransferase-1